MYLLTVLSVIGIVLVIWLILRLVKRICPNCRHKSVRQYFDGPKFIEECDNCNWRIVNYYKK